MITVIAIFIALVYYYNTRITYKGEKFTVFGTTWCGYTTKQREHLDKKYGRGSHTFVDCDKEDCGDIKAFPVTETPQGNRIKGFNQTI